METVTRSLMRFIDDSPTPYHAVENAAKKLAENGFTEVKRTTDPHGLPEKFFFTVGGSALIAVKLPRMGALTAPKSLRICASHTDSPCFKLKPNAVMTSDCYSRLNTERYGGGIWSTWLDRPLGVAGRVIVDENGSVTHKNVVIPGNILIPNVSIHMNRQLNEGYVYNAATDLVPLLGGKPSGDAFKKRLCEAAGCTEDKLLDYDLCVYNPQPSIIWGGNGEYFSAPRIDDLQCLYTTLLGFIQAEHSTEYASVLALLDCEEVGSGSAEGADSDILRGTAAMIADRYGVRTEQLTPDSFMLSADNAHALHPNKPELSDPTNRPILGGGVVLKYNSSKRYMTDGESAAFVKMLCRKNGIPLQTFANRSDMAGGSTLGNISATQLSVKGADIGLPQLAMHSAYETAACADCFAMTKLISAFFSE